MARIIFKLEDGTEIETELDADLIAIGRHPGSHVVLPSASVSAHHATIKRRGEAYFVQDLGTTNGTKLNGVEVEEAKLEDGDRLSFGDVPGLVQFKDAPVKKKSDEESKQAGKVNLAPKPGGRRSYSSATYSQSSGCAGFFAILVFLTVAFVAGLFIRHYVAHDGRFLLTDVVHILRDKLFGDESEAPANGAGKNSKKDSKSGG